MVQGKTRTGFEFTVDEAILNDMELIDALADTMGENPLAFSVVCTKLFGAEQKKRLYDHCREEGRVPVQKISEEIADVFKAIGEAGKNS